MLKIWGRLSSINVRKVVWAAQELAASGLSFERTDAGLSFGITQTPGYLQKNPNAQVPLIEDGDFALWESNVIVRYLVAKHAEGALYPTELQARFDAERWMDWQQTAFNAAGREAFVQLIRTPADKRNPDAVRASVVATETLMTMLDAHLSQHAYMGGAQFGMADIPLGCEMHRWWGISTELFTACSVSRQSPQAWPHVQRWYASLLARPASRGVLDLPLS
jgi:glutathione S-transferase